MADITQIGFTYREVIEALLRQQKITEGCWTLSVDFSFGAVTAGPTPDESHPTAVVSVTGFGLVKVELGTQGIYVDANTLTSKTSSKIKSKKIIA